MQVNGIEINVTPEQLLHDLKQSLEQNGIYLLHTIKPTGDNIMFSCPSHKNGQERKPSCGMSIVDKWKGEKHIPAGIVHCFTCNYTATLTEFISYCFGYKDGGIFGNKWLKNNYGFTTGKNRHLDLKIGGRTNVKQELPNLPQEVLQGYRYIVDYMYDRGLTDDIIEQFDIGYDKELDAITIPVTDLKGNVKWIQKRLISYKQYLIPEGITKTDYLLGASEILRLHLEKQPVYIVESPFNMLTCWCYGKPAVCLFGTGGGNQYKLLERLPIRHYIIALDPDDAGKEGSRKLVKHLKGKKLLSKLHYTDTRDINELQEEFTSLKISLINL